MASSTLEALQTALAGRYTVDREIGRGGMATVLLARDVKHGRPVALKLLRPELAAQLGTDRFLREIEIAARLAHPNILPLLDSGIIEKGHGTEAVPYYVMPYVEGESLRDRLTQGPLPTEEAIRLLVEVADALDCAHRQGIVHRDIKPDNILLQQGHAVVSDFGIARAISAATGVARLTETGMSLGTRGYMSPEQFAGLEVDQRSDVYSLGCLAVEMLTGRPPVLGESGVGRVEPATLRRPIGKALATLPADRWATAGDFAAALRRRRASRSQFVAMAALGTAVLLMALLTLVREGPGFGGAVADRRMADSLVRRAGALVSDRTVPHLEEAIASLWRVLQQDSANARAWAVLARAYAGADRWGYPVAGVPPESLGPMALQFSERAVGIDSSDSQVWVGRGWVDEFLDPARKRVALRSYRRATGLDSTNAEAWSRLGFLLLENNQFDEGLAAFRRAFGLDPDRNHYLLPVYFLWTRQADSARKWADSAVAVAPDAYFARVHAGSIALEAHDLDGAEAQFSAAQRLETGAEIGGLCGLAAVAAERGERSRAREFLAQAAAKSDSVRPPVHNAVQLAAAWTALGKHDEALAWLERFEPVVDLHFQLHLKRDPMLDGLHQEPRFQRLLRPLPR